MFMNQPTYWTQNSSRTLSYQEVKVLNQLNILVVDPINLGLYPYSEAILHGYKKCYYCTVEECSSDMLMPMGKFYLVLLTNIMISKKKSQFISPGILLVSLGNLLLVHLLINGVAILVYGKDICLYKISWNVEKFSLSVKIKYHKATK